MGTKAKPQGLLGAPGCASPFTHSAFQSDLEGWGLLLPPPTPTSPEAQARASPSQLCSQADAPTPSRPELSEAPGAVSLGRWWAEPATLGSCRQAAEVLGAILPARPQLDHSPLPSLSFLIC